MWIVWVILSICCHIYYATLLAILENHLVMSSSLSLLLMVEIKMHPPPKRLVGSDVIQQQGRSDTGSKVTLLIKMVLSVSPASCG